MKFRTKTFDGLNEDEVHLGSGQRRSRADNKEAEVHRQFRSVSTGTDINLDQDCCRLENASVTDQLEAKIGAFSLASPLASTKSSTSGDCRRSGEHDHSGNKATMGSCAAEKDGNKSNLPNRSKNSRSLFGGLRKKETKREGSHIGEIKISKTELVSKAEKLVEEMEGPPAVEEKPDNSRTLFGGHRHTKGGCVSSNEAQAQIPKSRIPVQSTPTKSRGSDMLRFSRKPVAPKEGKHIGEIVVRKKVDELPAPKQSVEVPWEHRARNDKLNERCQPVKKVPGDPNATNTASEMRRSFTSVHERKGPRFLDKISRSMTSHQPIHAHLNEMDGSSFVADDDSFAQDLSDCPSEPDGVAETEEPPRKESSDRQSSLGKSLNEDVSRRYYLDNANPVIWQQGRDEDGGMQYLEMNIKRLAQSPVKCDKPRLRLGVSGYA